MRVAQRLAAVVGSAALLAGCGVERTAPPDPSPTTSSPPVAGTQPIRNLDAANLALRLLRLPALDDGLDTRPLSVR